MTEYVFPVDRRVTSEDGVHSLFFQAGVPRKVPAKMERLVIAAGAFPADAVATVQVEKYAVVPGIDITVPVDAETVIATDDSDDGGRYPEGVAEGEQADGAIEAIAEVMKEILAEGRDELLTATGIPRAYEIESRLGWDTSKEQREAAWALVE